MIFTSSLVIIPESFSAGLRDMVVSFFSEFYRLNCNTNIKIRPNGIMV